MAVLLSITGLFKMILIIIGAIVLLRFFGQLMNAKRNMEEERNINERERKLQQEKERKQKNLGKTHFLTKNADGEDVEFEEVN